MTINDVDGRPSPYRLVIFRACEFLMPALLVWEGCTQLRPAGIIAAGLVLAVKAAVSSPPR
jgi:hypothetical protein